MKTVLPHVVCVVGAMIGGYVGAIVSTGFSILAGFQSLLLPFICIGTIGTSIGLAFAVKTAAQDSSGLSQRGQADLIESVGFGLVAGVGFFIWRLISLSEL